MLFEQAPVVELIGDDQDARRNYRGHVP
jgi:hypothetical protein